MGLRINTNISSITALRVLKQNQTKQASSLERLSTGLRINRGSDDPSGLVISEQLRSQLKALDQSISNSQNATNLLNVADAALQEVSNLLVEIQTSITFAQNTGGSTPEQIAAEQDAVDQAISAIDRIATTTRYADRPLLNGQAAYQTSGNVPDFFDDVNIKSVSFANNTFERTLDVNAQVNPQRAEIRIAGASTSATGGATIRISGARGTETIVLNGGSDQNNIAAAINSVAGHTGVFASASTGGGGTVLLRSEEFGKDQNIKIEGVSGTLTGTIQTLDDGVAGVSAGAGTYTTDQTDLTAGDAVLDRGANGSVTFEGQVFESIGRRFNILTKTAEFSFNMDPDLITSTASGTTSAGIPGPGVFSLQIANTGLSFQLNSQPIQTDKLALSINAMTSSNLGMSEIRDRIAEAEIGSAAPGSTGTMTMGGTLNSIITGNGNDLFEDPTNAARIVSSSVLQVAKVRGYLGAVTADALTPNINALSVAVESLSASLSNIRDVDFAEETSSFTRSQILFQSGIGVLASANTLPQSVLQLLGG